MQLPLQQRYQTSFGLLTDLYQLTMAYGYWKHGKHEQEAVFHWFYRKNPFKGDYVVACGLQEAIEFCRAWRFDESDIAYLRTLSGNDNKPMFEEGFLQYLSELRFTCDIDAVEEGTVVFPHEPLLRIKGNLLQAQLLETPLLTMLNFQTLIATKAARVVDAAQGDKVLEFGLRRAQGLDGGLSASRAAYIGGCYATSNVLAGKLFDIPVRGTHAHAWVMSFDSEREAFAKYAEAMPNNCTFLVDTYDTLEGVRHAIEVGQELRQRGYTLQGIRLDSGNLATLSKAARQLLDEAGFTETAIVASDDLNEYRIAELKQQGAAINIWGVGTQLVTAYDQPALGGVYKLAAIRNESGAWDYKIKLSENPIKVSNPGVLQVRRYSMSNGEPFGDMIWNEKQRQLADQIAGFDGRTIVASQRAYEDLLKPILRQGELVYSFPSIHAIRARALNQVALFKSVNFGLYPVGLATELQTTKLQLMSALAKK